ncbi:hypothetical protein niasHS_017340 [Heterodera schachtii]|uniref:Uncharacterized protein n=1 Tax=Heterodera schachtii TaxID=97005 RepID=A0ABD2HNM4_HETSC
MQCLLTNCYSVRYNCTFYNYESIPREKRRNIGPGIILLLCYFIFELLYVPCIVVFAQKKNIRESCYKLLLFMGLVSMVNIHSGCLLIGTYAVRGDVFCDRPLFNYIVGMAVFAFYTCECMVSVILALNRCIAMLNDHLARALFDGAKVYIWIGISICYGIFMGFFFIPPIPNGMTVGYFWQAHIGYIDDTEGWYQHLLFPYHNFTVALSIPTFYMILYFMMRKKSMTVASSTAAAAQQQIRQQNSSERKRNKNIFLQVLLIGILTVAFAFLYVYIEYFPVSPWFIVFAHFSWASSQGLFAIIMITLNSHIRRSIKAVFIEPALSRLTSQANSTINQAN